MPVTNNPESKAHALRVEPALGNRDGFRYCDRCGAQIQGEGSWGHDDNCPKKSG